MSNSSESMSKSSIERAVTLCVTLLLPTVFGFFAIQYLWSMPVVDREPSRMASNPVVRFHPPGQPTPRRSSAVVERATTPEFKTLQPSVQRFSPRAALVTSEVTFNDDSALGNAPIELTDAGRIIADSLAFAPHSLPERNEQSLREQLSQTIQLDLYGFGPESTHRFAKYRENLQSKQKRFAAKTAKLEREANRGELARRRLRSEQGRREARQNISAEIFGTKDPFRPPFEPLMNWIQNRDDLGGLPFEMGDNCRLESAPANSLQNVSVTIRKFRRDLLCLPDPSADKEATLLKWVRDHPWADEHVAGLVQIMSGEHEPMRLELVRILKKLHNLQSTLALARIAVFDLSENVRRSAVAGLRNRRPNDYRNQLLKGLRYVWAPAADNAARALVMLNDRLVYNQLVEMIGEDDPRMPYRTKQGHWATRELVRVNHMRNCLLCHAPAVALNARVTGSVPSPFKPLPRESYLGSGILVRADVTYLRQDFSALQTVNDHKPWPELQRFDYLVRERQLTQEEATELTKQLSDTLYPQRAAVLYAMRKLRPGHLPAEPLLSSAD